MLSIDDLLDGDLGRAARAAADEVPDVVAALDQLVPMLGDRGNPALLRRYRSYVEAAARALAESASGGTTSNGPEASGDASQLSATTLYAFLEPVFVYLPWVAPSSDGIGMLTVLVDRVRGLVGGLPHRCVRARGDIDEQYLAWFSKAMDDIGFERRCATPLRRAMKTLDLNSGDMAALMGVTRQAVDRWLASGPPPERLPKIGTVVEIADVLRHRLRDGMPPIVARRPASAYGDRTVLDLIAADEHDWLLRDLEAMFDYSTTA